MDGAGVEADFHNTQMVFNVSKDMGDMGFNLLYVSTETLGGEYCNGFRWYLCNGYCADVSFGYYTAEGFDGTGTGLAS